MYAWLRLAVSGCNEGVSNVEHAAAVDDDDDDDDADTHDNANGILMIK